MANRSERRNILAKNFDSVANRNTYTLALPIHKIPLFSTIIEQLRNSATVSTTKKLCDGLGGNVKYFSHILEVTSSRSK